MDRFRRAAVVCMLAVAGLGLSWAPAAPLPGARASVHIPRAVRVAHAALSGGLSAQPVLGVPALDFTLVGGSPGEATGEAWAQGDIGDVPASIGARAIPPGTQVLMRYTSATGTWQIVPVDDAQGQLLPFGWVASEVTAAGGVALIGTDSATQAQTLVTRDPGAAAFAQAPPPPASWLRGGESLYPSSAGTSTVIPTMATLDEGGQVGVLVAPSGEDAAAPGVLHYVDGPTPQWSREPICAADLGGTCTTPGPLSVDAVSASSPTNAWLLASVSGGHGPPELFQRQTGPTGSPVWLRQQPSSPLLSSTSVGGFQTSLPSGPILTAVGQGVWVDVKVTGVSASGDATVYISPSAPGETVQTWCYPTSICPSGAAALGAPLPDYYGSFAWAGSGPTDPGTRIITGLPHSVLLHLSAGAGAFAYQTTDGGFTTAAGGGGTFGAGGEALAESTSAQTGGGGAAFSSPTEGWLGTGDPPPALPPAIHLTTSPSAGALTAWPLPFRFPLTAVAGGPGGAGASGQGSVLAVGADGEIGRYIPGQGWSREFLYSGSGAVQTPTLRGAAWPEPGRGYAVGDNGAMWLWRSATGLWEPDPARPLNFEGNLTAIAFSSTSPALGYAVGKQGVLLAYGKTWTQQSLPAAVAQAELTSVTFAGNEAIVAYRMPDPDPATTGEVGGLLMNDGSGWQLDPSAQALLAQLPPADTVITKVAGLLDGGAVAAGPGVVIERDSATSPWRFSSLPLADADQGNIAAIAAIRDGASVRALVAVDSDGFSDPSGLQDSLWQGIDNPPAPSVGQPPLRIGVDPLPTFGFLVRETAGGWVDQELQADPGSLTAGGAGGAGVDLPGWPDPVLALLVDPAGDQGWAVGGESGGATLAAEGQSNSGFTATTFVQTATALHFGPGPSPPEAPTAPISIPAGQATFAFGGGSGCAQACADDAGQNLGPDAWLSAAITRMSQVGGVRAFVYVGEYEQDGNHNDVTPDAFNRDLAQYAGVLSGGGSLSVYAAATPNDVDPAAGGSTDFAGILGAHVPAGRSPPGTPAPPAGTAAYAFDSAGPGATVRVIVLDYSAGTISAGGQLQWLATELDDARQAGIPAIVVGGENISDSTATNYAADAPTVVQVLLGHGASAYVFYDATQPQENVSETIGPAGDSIPAYGAGTLGYVLPPVNRFASNLGASGTLLVSVDGAQRDPGTNRAPVSVQLIPNAGALALSADDGTLLRRSVPALFQAQARRPAGGEELISGPGGEVEAPDPYTTLPDPCLQGGLCSRYIQPIVAFSSSDTQVGDFVEANPNDLTNPRDVFLSAAGKPVPDPSSGLFCPYNPGTTTVTVTTGGLGYSVPVTVQAGSVRLPCGTVAVRTAAVTKKVPTPPPPPPPPPAPVPVSSHQPPPVVPRVPHLPMPVSTSLPSPPPSAARVAPPSAPTPRPAALPAVPPGPQGVPPPPRILVPVAPPAVRPLPPTGFGTVPSGVPLSARAVEREKKKEEAVESARNDFAVYRPDDGSVTVTGVSLLLLVVAGGLSGAQLRRRSRPRGAAAYVRTDVRPPRRW